MGAGFGRFQRVDGDPGRALDQAETVTRDEIMLQKGHASQYGHQSTENIYEKTNQDVKVKLEASV